MKKKIFKVMVILSCMAVVLCSFAVFSVSATVEDLKFIGDHIGVGVKILMPLDGFKQAEIDMVVVDFVFKIYASEDVQPNQVKISASNAYISNAGVDYSDFAYVGNGYAVGSYRISGKTGFGSKSITVKVTDQYGKEFSDSVYFTCFEGFQDENGDGKDDRIGRDDDGDGKDDDYQTDPSNPTIPYEPPAPPESIPLPPNTAGPWLAAAHNPKPIDGYPNYMQMHVKYFDPVTNALYADQIFTIWTAESCSIQITPTTRPSFILKFSPGINGRQAFTAKTTGDWSCNTRGVIIPAESEIDTKNYESFPGKKYEIVDIKTYGNITILDENGHVSKFQGESNLAKWSELLDEGINIISPRNGFSQSQIDTVAMSFAFKIPCAVGSKMSDFSINVGGYVSDQETDHSEMSIFNGVAMGYYTVVGKTGFGKNRTLTVQIIDPSGKKWQKSISVSCYQEFVDVDGDGRDDRAGDDYWENNPANRTNNWGNMTAGNFSLEQSINGVSSFFQTLYAVIPPPIMAIVIAGMGFLLVLAIKRLVL